MRIYTFIGIKLISAYPRLGEKTGQRIVLVNDMKVAFLHIAGLRRVVIEPSAHEFPVPGPLVLCVRSSVNTDIAATRLNKPLKSVLLSGIQHIPGSGQPDDAAVLFQILFIEGARIFRGIYFEAVFSPHFHQSNFSVFNGCMTKRGCFTENQHTGSLCCQ